MTSDEEVRPEGTGDADLRPGPLAWAAIAVGWTVIGISAVGAFGDMGSGDIWSWVRWVVGAALVHDLVILPIVLAAGWSMTRVVPVAWRVPMRTALVVAGIVGLSVWPIARRWGARADNPSVLPLPVARNLAVLVAVLVVAAIGVGAVTAWRERVSATSGREDPS